MSQWVVTCTHDNITIGIFDNEEDALDAANDHYDSTGHECDVEEE